MDRLIQYGQQQGWAQDTLQGQLNSYLGLSYFMYSIIGNGGINGIVASPTAVPSLNIDLTNGEIYSVEPLDVTDYGTAPFQIPADLGLVLKQGVYDGGTFATPAPVTPGDTILYLVEVAFQEVDGVPVNRPFFTGSSVVNTQRLDQAIVQLKPGVPSPSPVIPTPDAGFLGLWVISVTFGQTTVVSGDITLYPGANVFGQSYGGALQDMLTQANAAATYLTQASAAATYLTQASAAATYAQRPNIGNNGYSVNGNGASNALAVTNTLLNLAYVSGESWISGNQLFVPFSTYLNGVVFIELTSVPNQSIEIEVVINGATTYLAQSYKVDVAGTAQVTIPISIYLPNTDYIEIYAREGTGGGATAQIINFFVMAVAN